MAASRTTLTPVAAPRARTTMWRADRPRRSRTCAEIARRPPCGPSAPRATPRRACRCASPPTSGTRSKPTQRHAPRSVSFSKPCTTRRKRADSPPRVKSLAVGSGRPKNRPRASRWRYRWWGCSGHSGLGGTTCLRQQTRRACTLREAALRAAEPRRAGHAAFGKNGLRAAKDGTRTQTHQAASPNGRAAQGGQRLREPDADLDAATSSSPERTAVAIRPAVVQSPAPPVSATRVLSAG